MTAVAWNTCQNCTRSANRRGRRHEIVRELSIATLARDGCHLYGPHLMRTGRPRFGERRRRSARTWSFLVGGALCSLAVTSCGSSSARPAAATSKPTVVGSTSTTTSADAQVISAWFAAEEAFHQAALTSDPNSPALLATMVSPELARIQASLSQFRANGDVAKGPISYGHPRITARGPAGIEVVSCVDGRDIEVSASTGRPITGVLGTATIDLTSSIMQATSSGWKLADQSVEPGKCRAS